MARADRITYLVLRTKGTTEPTVAVAGPSPNSILASRCTTCGPCDERVAASLKCRVFGASLMNGLATAGTLLRAAWMIRSSSSELRRARSAYGWHSARRQSQLCENDFGRGGVVVASGLVRVFWCGHRRVSGAKFSCLAWSLRDAWTWISYSGDKSDRRTFSACFPAGERRESSRRASFATSEGFELPVARRWSWMSRGRWGGGPLRDL